MREIKFRQYVFISRAFHYWGYMSPGEFVGPILDYQYATVSMQYTGRKDKNGKEIYEGDVVKIPEHYCGDNSCPEYVAEITYNAPEFQTEPWFGESWNDIEVISHIYETPELLDEEG